MGTPRNTMGERVARRRRELGLSQMDLAVQCGCSLSAVSKIEQGETENASRRTLELLSKVLGVSLDELVGGKKPARRA